MVNTTAVATLYTKQTSAEGQTLLSFNADNSDKRNKEWAKYTPGLVLNIHVVDAVAEQFEQGNSYLLNITEDNRPEAQTAAAGTEPSSENPEGDVQSAPDTNDEPVDSEPVQPSSDETEDSEPVQASTDDTADDSEPVQTDAPTS